MRPVWLLALLGIALALGAPPADARRSAAFGFNGPGLGLGHPDDRMVAFLHRAGARVARLDLSWRVVEPTPGARRWEVFDSFYGTLTAAGVEVLPVLRSVPAWAQDGGLLACGVLNLDYCQRPPSPQHLEAWRAFVRDVAERYPNLAGVEVFNEPNYADYNWLPRADPAYYTRVLRTAHEAVKAVRPGLPVVVGGLSNSAQNTSAESLSDEEFLQGMYDAGVRGAMDAIGIHPYAHPEDPRPADSDYHKTLTRLRSVRERAGDAGTPFWITETGYRTGASLIGGVSPADQADFLAAIVRLARREPDVAMVLVHTLVDRNADPFDHEAGYGVVRSDLTPKPSLEALAATVPPALTKVVLPRSFRVRLRVRYRLSKSASIRLTFRRRGRRHVMKWHARPGIGAHRLSLRPGGRRLPRDRYRVGLVAVDVHGNRSPVIRGSIRARGETGKAVR